MYPVLESFLLTKLVLGVWWWTTEGPLWRKVMIFSSVGSVTLVVLLGLASRLLFPPAELAPSSGSELLDDRPGDSSIYVQIETQTDCATLELECDLALSDKNRVRESLKLV